MLSFIVKIKYCLLLCFIYLINPCRLEAQSGASHCSEQIERWKSDARDLEGKGYWAESIVMYQRGLSKAEELRADICIAGISRSIARVFSTIGDLYKSLDFKDSLFQEFTGYLNINETYREARIKYENALAASIRANDPLGLFYARYGIATTNQNLGNFQEAVTDYDLMVEELKALLNSSLTKDLKSSYSSLLSWVLSARSLIIYEESQYDLDSDKNERVLRDYDLAETLVLESGESSGLIEIYHNKAMAFGRLSQLDSALIYNHKSLSESMGGGLLYAQSKSWYQLASLYEEVRKPDSALHYWRLYDQSHDVLMGQSQQSNIAKLVTLLRLERKEKELEKLKIVVAIAVVLLVLLIITVIYSIQRRRALKKISDQKINDLLQQQEIRSLQGVLAGQEEERKRIAGDLHDKLGAILGMVKLHFSAVEDRIDTLREDNKLQYEKANDLLDQASDEVRNISHNLISGVLTKFGLVPALHDLKETIQSTGKLNIQLIISDMVDRLDGERELQIYRIIQELLSNILKHSQASEADIQLTRINGKLNLLVHDNGIGFDPEAAKAKRGMGMQNLQARVDQLSGTLHYDSGRGAGTTVSIDVPIKD